MPPQTATHGLKQHFPEAWGNRPLLLLLVALATAALASAALATVHCLSGCLQGYCYVNYSTPAAAAAAQADLNGVEYPVGSGFRLKVMYAEIMTGEASSSRG